MSDARNPYVHSKEKSSPQLKVSVVAFIDILGYLEMARSAAESNTESEVLSRLHSALEGGKKRLENKDIDAPKFGDKDYYAVKSFTDNIVIGWPIRDDAESELGDAFFKLSMYQFEMALSGFFVRGGISIGPLYMDDVTVFGNGLNEAYYAESQLARDPRVVLTTTAVGAIQNHISYYGDPKSSPQVKDLFKDSDGQIFLNYLDTVLMADEDYGPFYDELLQHKTIVEDKLEKHKSNPNIWSKYAWVANYHNFFCEQHPKYFDQSHKISESEIKLAPARLV